MRLKIVPVLLHLICLSVFPFSTMAKDAQPMAADPEMEKIVNEISEELRCLVCQNQTISDSNAALAIDLKNQVRDMVAAGKGQKEIVDYMVQRYGDFVRYRPPMKPTTVLLWIGPFVLMAGGLVLLILNLKRRKQVIADAPLSEEESDRLQSLLDNETNASAKKAGGEVK